MKRNLLMLLSLILCLMLSSCSLIEIYTGTVTEVPPLTGTVTVGIGEEIGGTDLLFPGGEEGSGLVRQLIYGCNTTAKNEKGIDTYNKNVVKKMSWTEEADGSRSYIFELKDDLCFSDGQPITAKDYVFGILMQSSVVYGALGGDSYRYALVDGHMDYRSGKSDVFSGVKLLSEYKFSLRISSENLPYFFEYLELGAEAYPMHAIAPNATIVSSNEGAKIENLSRSELRAILIKRDGFAAVPTVSSGPFTVVSHQKEMNAVILKANPHYRLADKASVEQLIIKYGVADPASAMISGLIDVAYGYQQIDTVSALQAVEVKNDLSDFAVLSDEYYCLSFDISVGITADAAVRKAAAFSMDRLSLAAAVTGSGEGVLRCFASPESYPLLNNPELSAEDFGYRYSPAAAKEYLTGYEAPTVQLIYDDADAALAAMVTASLEEAGFTVADRSAQVDQDCGRIILQKRSFIGDGRFDYGADPQLFARTLRLASTYPEEYTKAWLDFQTSAMENLKFYPLFCSIEHSFYTDTVDFTFDDSIDPVYGLSSVYAK